MHEGGKNEKKEEVSAGCGGPQAEQTLTSQPTGWGGQAAVPVHAECSLQHQDQQPWSQGALFAELAGSPRELSK